jgi:hypothetical protein
MLKVIVLDRPEESLVTGAAHIDPFQGLAVLNEKPSFNEEKHLWTKFSFDDSQDESQRRAIEAYCMGHLQYYEEQVRGGYKSHYIYFEWTPDRKLLKIYLDPAPNKDRPGDDITSHKKVFGQTTSMGAVLNDSQKSPAPPPARTATVSDPPPPKQPPPPPL